MSNFKCRFRVTSNKLKEYLKEKGSLYNITIENNEVFFNDVADLKKMLSNVVESSLKRTNFSAVNTQGHLEKIGVIKNAAGKKVVDIKPEHLTPEFIDTLDLRTPGSIRKEFLNTLNSYKNMFLGKSPKGKLTKEELVTKLETMSRNLEDYSTGENPILNAAQKTEILLDVNGLKELAHISESDNKYRPNNLPIVQFLYNGIDEVQNYYESPDRIKHTPEQFTILSNLIQSSGRSFTREGDTYTLVNNGIETKVNGEQLYVAKTKFELEGKNVNQVLIGSNPFSNIIPPVTDSGRLEASKVLSALTEDEIKEKLVIRLTNTSAVTANNEVRLAYGQIETFETAQQQAHLQAGGNPLVVKHRMQDFDALLIINHNGKDILIGHLERLNYAKVSADNARVRLSSEELAQEIEEGSLFDYMSNEDRDNPIVVNLKDNEYLKTSMLQDLALSSEINKKIEELYEQHGNSDFKYSDIVNIKKAVFTLDFNKDGISPTSDKLKDSLDSTGQPFIIYEGKLINGSQLEFDTKIQATGLNGVDFLADKLKGTLQQVIFYNGVHKAPVTGNKLTFSDPVLKSTLTSIFTDFNTAAQGKSEEQLVNAVKTGLNNKLPFGFYGSDGKFWTISISPYLDSGEYQLVASSFTNNKSEEKFMAFTDPLVGFLKLAKELGATQAQYTTDARNGKLDLTNFNTRISENVVKNTLKVSIKDETGKELEQPDEFDFTDYDDDIDFELLKEANETTSILLDKVEERLAKILPADISVVKTTSDSIKSVSMTGTPVAAFFKKVIYLTDKAGKGTEYHEAYHALEKHSLSKEEVSALHAFASSITYSNTFASERGLTHLSKQQLEYKQRQEHIADTFKAYMNDRTGKTLPELIKSIFNKIIDFLKYITNNQSEIESIFYRIRKGYYVNKPSKESEHEDYDYEILKYKQSTKDGIVEVASTSNQRNNIISYVAIRTKQTNKQEDLKEHVQHYIDKYAAAFENIKTTLNEDKTKTNKTFKGEDRTNALTFYQNYRLVKEVGAEAVATNIEDEVKERLKNVGQVYSFNDEVEFDETGNPIVQEETTVVEETGRASFDTSNLALNPEDKLSRALKSWISFANNTITIGQNTVFKAVDQTRIYNALLKALSGQKREDIFDTLEAYSKFDKDLEIFWNYAKQEFGASFDGTKWVPSIINQQLEQFYNGFQVAHFSYVDTVQDSKGAFYNVNAAYQDFITKGTAEWENYYTQRIQDLLKVNLAPDPKTGKTRKDRISALRQLLDFGERALNGTTENVDNSVDKFYQGLSQYVPISKGYLTYAIYDKNRDKLTDRQARILKYLENNGNRIPFDTTIFDNFRHLNDSLTKEINYVPNLFRDQPVQATGIEASTKMVKLVEADYYAQFGSVPLSIRTPDGKARYSIARQSFLVERFNQTKDVEFRRNLKDNPLSDEKYDSILSNNSLIISNGIRLANSEAKTWGENNGIEYGYHTMSLFIESITKSNYTKMQCVLAQHETSNTNTLIELPYENLFSMDAAKEHFKKMFLYECKQVINGTIRATENNRLLLEDPTKRRWSNLLQSKSDFEKGLPVNLSKARSAQFWFFKNLLKDTDNIYSKVRSVTTTEINNLIDRPEVVEKLEEIFEEAFVDINEVLSQDIKAMLSRRSNDFQNDKDKTWLYTSSKDGKTSERRLANEFYQEEAIPMPELPELDFTGLSKEEIKQLKKDRREELKSLTVQNEKENARAQLTNLFTSSYLNTTIQTYWYHQMYFGNLQSFKDGLDQTKRMKLLNVSGSTLVGGKFEMIDEPVETTTNPNFTDGNPREVEHADGQIYGPVFQKLLYQKRLGRMSESVRDIYIDAILGLPGTEEGRKALENENCTLESTKVTIVGANKDGYGDDYMEYIKCSQTWMVRSDTSYYHQEDGDKMDMVANELKELLKRYVGNEPFNKEELDVQLKAKFKEYHQYWHPLPSGKFGHDMLNKMESELIGFMIPPSASKAFQKKNGVFSDSQVRLQVETHSTEEQITKGTQAYEVIHSEIDPNEPVRINGVDTTLGEVQKAWRQSLANTLNNDVNLISNLFDTEAAQAKARALASGDLEAYQAAIDGSKIDMNLLSAKMMNSLEASSAADKIIDWFKMVDGKPEYLWDAALTLDKFQQQLMAEFSKNIFSKKTAGTGAIIVSPTNYKVLSTEDGFVIPLERQKGYVQTGDNTWKKEGFREATLRPLKIRTYTDSLGRLVEEIECVIPKKWAHDFELGKVYDPQKLKKVAKLYGYRIPTEDKRSIQVLKVVDYLDPLLGDIIIMAKEAQIKSGHDYDVDKQYTEFPRMFKFKGNWYTYNDYVTIEDQALANEVKWAGYYNYITSQKAFTVLKKTLKDQAYDKTKVPISVNGDIFEIDSNDEQAFNEATLAFMGYPATLEQLNKAEQTLGHTLNVYKQQQDQLDLQRVIVQSQSFEKLNNDETSTTETEKWAQHAEDNIQTLYNIPSTKLINTMSDWGKQQMYTSFVLSKKSLGIAAQSAKVNNWLSRGFMDLKSEVQFGFKYGENAEENVSITKMGPNFINKLGKLVPHPDYKYDRWLDFQTRVMQVQIDRGLKLPMPTEIRRTGANLGEQVSAVADDGKLQTSKSLNMNPQMIGLRSMMFQLHIPAPIVNTIMTHPATYKLAAYLATTGGKVGDRNMYFNAYGEFEGIPDFITLQDLMEPTIESYFVITKLLKKLYELSDSLISVQAPLSLTKGLAPILPDMVKIDKFISEFDLESVHGESSIKTWKKPPVNLEQFKSIYLSDPYITNLVNKWLSIKKLIERSNLFLVYSADTTRAMQSISERVQNFNAIKFFEDIPKYTYAKAYYDSLPEPHVTDTELLLAGHPTNLVNQHAALKSYFKDNLFLNSIGPKRSYGLRKSEKLLAEMNAITSQKKNPEFMERIEDDIESLLASNASFTIDDYTFTAKDFFDNIIRYELTVNGLSFVQGTMLSLIPNYMLKEYSDVGKQAKLTNDVIETMFYYQQAQDAKIIKSKAFEETLRPGIFSIDKERFKVDKHTYMFPQYIRNDAMAMFIKVSNTEESGFYKRIPNPISKKFAGVLPRATLDILSLGNLDVSYEWIFDDNSNTSVVGIKIKDSITTISHEDIESWESVVQAIVNMEQTRAENKANFKAARKQYKKRDKGTPTETQYESGDNLLYTEIEDSKLLGIPSSEITFGEKNMVRQYTPENITSLKSNEIFVFGSNEGSSKGAKPTHGAGAAKIARDKFGAIQGQSRGLQGQSYAIVTKKFYDVERSSTKSDIYFEIVNFVKFANEHTELTFYVTKIGSSLAGYSVKEIKGLFEMQKDNLTDNIILPKEYEVRDGNSSEGVVGSIYSQLGSKTATGNVVIKSVYQQEGVQYAKSIGGVFINFQEEPTSGYRTRTIKNASADATIALAYDFNSAGEKLTKSSVLSQNKKYIRLTIPKKSATSDIKNANIKTQVDLIVSELNAVNAKTLNIAGNGIYTMREAGWNQEEVDLMTYRILKGVIESPDLKTKIESVRTGGQTGFDEAGAKAAAKLGIPTLILAPKGWTFRNINGQDISNEQQFKARFQTNETSNTNNNDEDQLPKCIEIL